MKPVVKKNLKNIVVKRNKNDVIKMTSNDKMFINLNSGIIVEIKSTLQHTKDTNEPLYVLKDINDLLLDYDLADFIYSTEVDHYTNIILTDIKELVSYHKYYLTKDNLIALINHCKDIQAPILYVYTTLDKKVPLADF